MAKTSTKLLSFLLAVVMLVGLIPTVAFAEEAPQLISLNPTADMEIHSSSVEGNTYTYAVDYWNNNFKFTLEYEDGVTAKVLTNVGQEIQAESGVYTLPIRQMTEYTYYVTLSAPAENASEPLVNTYTLKISRLLNDEAEITAIEGDGFTLSQSGDTWTVEGDVEGKEIVIKPVFSFGATAVIKNQIGQSLPTDGNGGYIVKSNATLTVNVTAQNGVEAKTWYIKVLIEKGNADCTLSGIDDAVFNGEYYAANTTHEKFLVNATVPAGATYTLYKDEACTEKITNKELTLTEQTTTVYIVVTASDGETKSSATKLVINTTNVADGEDAPSGQLPFGGVPELYVRGGIPGVNTVTEQDAVIVPLERGTTSYMLEAKPFGYDLYLYADKDMKVLVKNNSEIALDGAFTILYAKLVSEDETLVVEVVIYSEVETTYTDTLTPWAAEAIEYLQENGYGYFKGNAEGAFDGTKALNRYEMAALTLRFKGVNKNLFARQVSTFADEIAAWAVDYVKAAEITGTISGIANGEQVEFQGKKSATRAQFVRVIMDAYLQQAFGKDLDTYYEENKKSINAAVKAMNFNDEAKVAEWAKPGLYTAISMGVISGSNGNINATGVLTRNQAAIIMYKLHTN